MTVTIIRCESTFLAQNSPEGRAGLAAHTLASHLVKSGTMRKSPNLHGASSVLNCAAASEGVSTEAGVGKLEEGSSGEERERNGRGGEEGEVQHKCGSG